MPEGRLTGDHVRTRLKVPPRHGTAFVIGFLKGRGAVRTRRNVLRNARATGPHFRSRGYCVSAVGPDEATIRKHVRGHEELETRRTEPGRDN